MNCGYMDIADSQDKHKGVNRPVNELQKAVQSVN